MESGAPVPVGTGWRSPAARASPQLEGGRVLSRQGGPMEATVEAGLRTVALCRRPLVAVLVRFLFSIFAISSSPFFFLFLCDCFVCQGLSEGTGSNARLPECSSLSCRSFPGRPGTWTWA